GVAQEDLLVGPVAHARARDAAARLADDLELADRDVGGEPALGGLGGPGAGDVGERARLAAPEAHRVGLPAAVDLDVEARGERVDDRGADAVQTAGCRVGATAELPARVEAG